MVNLCAARIRSDNTTTILVEDRLISLNGNRNGTVLVQGSFELSSRVVINIVEVSYFHFALS